MMLDTDVRTMPRAALTAAALVLAAFSGGGGSAARSDSRARTFWALFWARTRSARGRDLDGDRRGDREGRVRAAPGDGDGDDRGPVAAARGRRDRCARPVGWRAGLGRHSAYGRGPRHRDSGQRPALREPPRAGSRGGLAPVRHHGPCRRVRSQHASASAAILSLQVVQRWGKVCRLSRSRHKQYTAISQAAISIEELSQGGKLLDHRYHRTITESPTLEVPGVMSLSLYGKQMNTVFHLLGNNENAMTMSLGWCLSQVPSFLDSLGDELGTPNLSSHGPVIRMQQHQRGAGVTDLEIEAPNYAAWIFEAKRGFTVPSTDQLEMYSKRLTQPKTRFAERGIVVLAASDRRNRWLSRQIPDQINGIPVHALSWRDILRVSGQAQSNAGRAGKSLLRQFQAYIKSEGSMQDRHSNLVYVVSLSRKTFGGGNTTFLEVVNRYETYFHPVGGGRGGWPTEPPNYIAFRYDSKLQSIHHVAGYEIVTNLGPVFPNQPDEECGPRFLYHLGPPIRPVRDVPVGALWRASRVWCFIDTLLTSDTIVEALEVTKRRLEEL